MVPIPISLFSPQGYRCYLFSARGEISIRILSILSRGDRNDRCTVMGFLKNSRRKANGYQRLELHYPSRCIRIENGIHTEGTEPFWWTHRKRSRMTMNTRYSLLLYRDPTRSGCYSDNVNLLCSDTWTTPMHARFWMTLFCSRPVSRG